MVNYLLDRPILTIQLSELEHFLRLAQTVLEFDYDQKREERLFSRKDLEGLSPETRENLNCLIGSDVYRGYYWQIADDPQKVDFCFFAIPDQCLYLTNVPYLVLHHSPTGFAWGFNGSGPTDLGLNLGEYFCRKFGWTEPTVKLWKGQTASAAAYAARVRIRNWLNETLSQQQRIKYKEAESVVRQLLEAELNCVTPIPNTTLSRIPFETS
jgi:hypothetical protein